jgi:hypothetical protein
MFGRNLKNFLCGRVCTQRSETTLDWVSTVLEKLADSQNGEFKLIIDHGKPERKKVPGVYLRFKEGYDQRFNLNGYIHPMSALRLVKSNFLSMGECADVTCFEEVFSGWSPITYYDLKLEAHPLYALVVPRRELTIVVNLSDLVGLI